MIEIILYECSRLDLEEAGQKYPDPGPHPYRKYTFFYTGNFFWGKKFSFLLIIVTARYTDPGEVNSDPDWDSE